MQPSFSGLFVTWAYFPANTQKQHVTMNTNHHNKCEVKSATKHLTFMTSSTATEESHHLVGSPTPVNLLHGKLVKAKTG